MLYLIYIFFTLSGFIALIYESTWSHYLKLLLGHSSYGQILTLCIFMGGLGLGAFIAGKRAKRLKNPLYFYAVLELFIGIGGLFYHKAYLIITNLYFALASSYSMSPFTLNLLKITLITLITGPIAIMIGMTFPVLAIGLMRIVQDRGKTTLSRLYFTNSLGAAVGIMVTSYILIPSFGTVDSLTLAGLGNLIIALCFFFISKQATAHISNDSFATGSDFIEVDRSWSRQSVVLVWISVAFLTGLSSFIYEIGWLRMISMLIGSTTHSFDIMVSTFILGLALGGYFAKTLLFRFKNLPITLATVQILMGCFAMISIYLSNSFFELVRDSNNILLRTESSYYIFLVFKYILCLLLLFPTTFFAGMTLPLITYFLNNYTRDEQYTGSVYGWNTIGAILGAALGGLLVLPILQLKFTIASGAIIDIAVGFVLLAIYQKSKIRYSVAAALSSLVIIPVFFYQLDSFLLLSSVYRANTRIDPDTEIYTRDGRTSTVSMRTNDNTLLILSNGRGEAAISLTDKPIQAEYDQAAPAFIAMSMLNKSYNAAIIGMGSGMTAHYLLGDPLLNQLDLFEIEEEFYNVAKGFLPYNERVYTDKRINFIFDDARTSFHGQNKKYDLVVSQPSVIWVSGVSSLFTEQFYKNVDYVLKENGVLVQWLQLFELDRNLLYVIFKTINNVFPHAKIYINKGSPSVIIVASKQDIFPIYHNRFTESQKIKDDLNRFSSKIDFFTNASYVISTKSLGPLLDNLTPNSDFFPIVESRSEKSLFLRKRSSLKPFVNSLFYYQEVLEPDQFSQKLSQILKLQSEYKPDVLKMGYLNDLLKNADKDSDWNGIEKLFYELITVNFLRGKWNELETVQLFRKQVIEKNPPLQLRLKFLFLDHAINNRIEQLNKIIPNMIETINKDSLSTEMIRAIAIQCYRLNNYELFVASYNRFVKRNNKISRSEKILLFYMSQQIKNSNNDFK